MSSSGDTPREVFIVRTGTANLASVCAGFRRLGAKPIVTEDAGAIRAADRVVLPGVGAFGAAMARLEEQGLVAVLRERIAAGRPTFCVCLGLQLLVEASEETPGVRGLGIVPSRVTRFQGHIRVPQLGWNRVIPGALLKSSGTTPEPRPLGSGLCANNEPHCSQSSGTRWLQPGWAYFANSYKLDDAPAGWDVAYTNYGGRFVAALQRGAVLACQFHPELSGPWGLELMRRWVEGAERGEQSSALFDGGEQSSALSLQQQAGGTTSRQESLAVRIIPCLDVRDGRVVKGIRFQGLRDAGDPAQLAAAYEAQGADEIVVLDVSATPEGRANQTETVRKVRAQLSIPLTVGGGVRRIEDAGALLEAGADKVGVNTAAVRDPKLIDELARRFGCQCTILALDAAKVTQSTAQEQWHNEAESTAQEQGHDRAARTGQEPWHNRSAAGRWEVVITSGRERTGIDAVAWAREATQRGAGEILLTSWDRDGTRSGYDNELIAAISQAVNVPTIASGGAADAGHLVSALRAGADAVLAASIFHDGELTVADLKQDLRRRGVEVRP
jgi:imidazole glycerol-phosphate synthase subunit HisF